MQKHWIIVIKANTHAHLCTDELYRPNSGVCGMFGKHIINNCVMKMLRKIIIAPTITTSAAIATTKII